MTYLFDSSEYLALKI